MTREKAYISGKRTNRRTETTRWHLTVLVLSMLIVLAGVIRFGGMPSSAHGGFKEDTPAFKYYKSIEIKSGDTLWGIAREHMTDEYDSIQEYIDEIKQINHLTSDNIQDSKHLMIAYYDSEFKE